MRGRWTRIQNSDDLFPGTGPGDESLAATSFGAMAAAQTLEILIASGLPFDPEIIDAAKKALLQKPFPSSCPAMRK